jgi:hypothetical protein
MPLQMCVFSLLNLQKPTAMTHGGWPHATAVGHGGCKAASCRRGTSCNRRLQSPSAMAIVELSWPTTVRPQTAVGHEGRRGPRQLVVKTVKF